ncbi:MULTISPECIES: hypothetical protein [Streptomyces]|uniref:hypothetical protein n=1 Tax=Streptomyces TaxID=1883 RepID=UPI001E3F91B3|nr:MULTISPECIES: hypothetical protein [Streptomyces]UFQ15504.1 hypothetical protein J2N69_11155 [Streptomyces huasconensis]WCL85107.1 hypothetical protein PPN52_11165 [Streptomyces sp. JCM 35825]
MRPGSAELISALNSGERQPSQTVRLGGKDMSAQVQSWTLEQSYGTDLPDAMRAYSGSSSAQLSLTLGGTNGRSAPALYGPWAPRATGDVVRPGQSVVHGWGVGGQAVPTFRGSVRARSAQSGTDTVSVTALDGAERLRQPASLPRPSGGIDPDTPFGSATNWVSSPTWCVDHLLQRAGIHTCPPPRKEALLYASMHGGAAANIGFLKSLSGDWSAWPKTNAPWDCAVQGSSKGTTKAEYAPQKRSVNRHHSEGFFLEAWVDNTGVTSGTRTLDLSLSWVRGTAAPVYTSMQVDFSDGGTISYTNGTDPNLITNSSVVSTVVDMYQFGRFFFGMWLKFSSTGVATAEAILGYPDGTEEIIKLGSAGSAIPAGALGNVILRIGGLRVEAVQVSQLAKRPANLADATQKGKWKKSARLDEPNVPLRVIPVVSGSSWEVITSIAKATLSTAAFDGDGIFHWRNGSRWAVAPSRADLTVTSAREIAALSITEEIDACRNHCSVKWSNWFRVKANKATTKKTTPHMREIPAGGSYTMSWDYGDEELDTSPPFTANELAPDCIRFATERAGETVVYGAVEVKVTREAGALVLEMFNRSKTSVWLTPTTLFDGPVTLLTPSVDSGASPSDNWSAAWNTNSQKIYGVQEFEHDPGGWIQDSKSASAVASVLRDAGAYPLPLIGEVEILPDPRIQLGDVIRVVDYTGASLDTLAWVIGIRTSGAEGSVRQTLTLRATSYNGTPLDAGLKPDPPVDPSVSI